MALIVISTHSFPHEAHIAKANLESAGIPAFIFDEHMVSMNWFYSNAVGGVRLLVAQEYFDEAKQILATDYSLELEKELGIEPERLSCNACGSGDVEPFIKGKGSAFLMILLLNFPHPFYKKGFKCSTCGYFW